ncbi:MAG: lamin tail domain-containing protein [Bacteroidetes bacterium]|nr:lamin tail domain-containing protein [Bacteroidota bacterium]
MKMIRITTCFMMLPALSFCQLNDGFDDGDFLNQPAWTGNTAKFRVNEDYRLQLNDSDAGTAFLVTAVAGSGELEWRFNANLKFSPSGNNNARIYLFSSQPDLTGNTEAFFIQLGEAGSDDALELFFQDGQEIQSICRGIPGNLASSFNISVKILYDNGLWEILSDPLGGQYYQEETCGQAILNIENGYLGVLCTYTKSNCTKFYFDNFYMGPVCQDTIPPHVENLSIIDSLSLNLTFSENLDISFATLPQHYILQPASLHPDTAICLPENPSSLLLLFQDAFPNKQTCYLSLQGLADLSGNIMPDTAIPFTWFLPVYGDVVISEIMADPSPPVGLPDAEYVELYNASGYPVDMNGWSLTYGETKRDISGLIALPPQGYLILTAESMLSMLEPFGLIASLESLSLPNNGTSLSLASRNNTIIHEMYYDPLWHTSSDKKEGGYSLEMVNTFNPCLLEDNYITSTSPYGGSPGTENPVNNPFQPEINMENLCVLSDSEIMLTFSQGMDAGIMGWADHFRIFPGGMVPCKITGNGNYNKQFLLELTGKLQSGLIYELETEAGLLNCNGTVQTSLIRKKLGLPVDPFANSIVINEILFDPLDGCGEYIELYNASSETLELSECGLYTVKERWPDPPDTTGGILTDCCLQLLPGEYVVFTGCPEKVRECYYVPGMSRILCNPNFPSLNNESGRILLTGPDNLCLDAVDYSVDMHYPLLVFTDGISLERINPAFPSSDPENWHSAAQDFGFGTPGRLNSQYAEVTESTDILNVTPKVIYPGSGSGENSVCTIAYQLEQTGCTGNLLIFDDMGYPLRRLAEQVLLGASGTFIWDGLDERNTPCRKGIYIIYFQVTGMDGKVSKCKETVVVAGY